MTVFETEDSLRAEAEEVNDPRRCCQSMRFSGRKAAQGFNILGTGRGPIVMSNVFLSTALIYLAAEEVGCLEEDKDGEMVVTEDCDERVYGAFRPAALITNIAVISGVLSAVFMPVAGALIDFTSHRWNVGAGSAFLQTLIQIVQCFTSSKNWFYMAILQALTGFFFQVQVLAVYAYLPDIAREVKQVVMNLYNSTFTMVQFGSQAVYLLIVVALSIALGFGDVNTARLGQAINSVNLVISFYFGWKLMPKVEPRHVLKEGESVLVQGFIQNWKTAKNINRFYKRSIRWFLLGILFSDSAVNAFTVVSVTYLSDQLKMESNQIGIFFLIVLIAFVPGCYLTRFASASTNPNTSTRLSLMVLFVVTVIGALVQTRDNVFPVTYIWGICVGVLLGWYYTAQQNFLSLVVPLGQEAELSGFYVYCTQILAWLPPLGFSVLVENGIDQNIGVIACSSFLLIGIALFSMAAPWDELLEEVHNNELNRQFQEAVLADGVVENDFKAAEMLDETQQENEQDEEKRKVLPA